MVSEEKKVKYPQNLYLKDLQKESGKSVKHLAKKVGCSTVVLSQIINGHYLGQNIVPLLLKEINNEEVKND